MIETLKKLIVHFLKKDYVRFIIVGAGGFIIHLSLASLCFRIFKLNESASFSIAFVISTTYAFFLNKAWVFSNDSKRHTAQYAAFFSGRLLSYLVTLYTTYIMTQKMGVIFEISQVVNTLINFMINYFFAKLVVFRKKRTAPEKAKPGANRGRKKPASRRRTSAGSR